MNFRFVLLSIVLVSSLNVLKGQDDSRWELGGYYTYLSNRIDPDNLNLRLGEHFLNVHGRYRFAKRWKAGVELLGITISGSNLLDNPYTIIGTYIDWILINGDKAKLNIRGGLSTGNILFVGDELPRKQWVINRIIGTTLDIKLNRVFYLQFGYFNHFPLNNIKFKYGIAQPVLGVYVKL